MEEIMTQAIKRAAAQLIAELYKKSLTPPLQISKGEVKVNWYDDTSCYVTVATFGGDRLLVQTWYDYTLDDVAPAFWVGFGAKDKATIRELLDDCSSEFPSPHEFKSIKALRDTPLEKVLVAPIAEFYGELNGFGIYGEPGSPTLDLPQASDFVERVLRSLPEFRAMEILRDIKAIESDRNVSETEREALIKARLGQGKFRADLKAVWNNKCAVLGCSTHKLLRASHIQPWSKSSNEERLDPNNGLLLAAHLDALFDAFLISFEDDGRMMISTKISIDDQEQLKLGGKLRKQVPDRMKKYLAYHREKFSGQKAPSSPRP